MDDLSTRDKIVGSIVSLVQRFHCSYIIIIFMELGRISLNSVYIAACTIPHVELELFP